MQRSFLNAERPLLTCMVQAHTPERIKELIDLSLPEGAEAFGMQLCRLQEEYKNAEIYKELFAYAKGKPVYVTNYRKVRGKVDSDKSDEIYAEELIEIAECGATLVDVMGDYFDPCEGELTMDADAVRKQKELIGALHQRGAEVLMSSHVLKYVSAERVLEIALAQEERGADIAKIVVCAENTEEQLEVFRAFELLKANLKIPFLFLSGGECSHLSRRIGGVLGNCMSLCVYEYDALATAVQPLLRDMKLVRELLQP